MASNPQDIFRCLNADDACEQVVEVESLCMNCEENGVTKLMFTSIPYFKTIIISSFRCEHCGYTNNDIKSAEAAQEQGVEIVLKVKQPIDIRRQVVKSEYCSIRIPDIELTMPKWGGEITTVEGILEHIVGDLNSDAPVRQGIDETSAKLLDDFLERVERLRNLKQPWTLILRDPSGNSFVENPIPHHVDPRCITSHFHRSLDDRKTLGLADDKEDDHDRDAVAGFGSRGFVSGDMQEEVFCFPTDCPNCGVLTETHMKPTNIPYFQQVIIMATTCDHCGHKTSEVKSGESIKDHGCKLSLTVQTPEDLARDVLKSDTCSMSIPELDLDVGYGALSGRFTTIEGLLIATKEQLREQSSFFFGDSAGRETRDRMDILLQQFDEVLRLARVVTVVLDDPAGNSYVQSLTAPLSDERLRKDFYERNFDQNEELGLNDMKVQNYEEMGTIVEQGE